MDEQWFDFQNAEDAYDDEPKDPHPQTRGWLFSEEYSDAGADYEEDRMTGRFDERNHYGDF